MTVRGSSWKGQCAMHLRIAGNEVCWLYGVAFQQRRGPGTEGRQIPRGG